MSGLIILLLFVLNLGVILVSKDSLTDVLVMQAISFSLVAIWQKLTWKQSLVTFPIYCLFFYFFTMLSAFVLSPLSILIAYGIGYAHPELLQISLMSIGYALLFGLLLKIFAFELGLRPAETVS